MNAAPAANRWMAPQRPSAAPLFAASPHRLATGLALFYTFLLMSRAVEILPSLVGVNTRLVLILLPILSVAALFSGSLLETLKTPVFLMFSGFTAWLCLAVLGSQWKGGSANLVLFVWTQSFLSMLLVTCLISTIKQCRQMAYTLAFALLPVLLTTIVFHYDVGGRDGSAFGSLGNPNDLAFAIMLLIPFAVFVIQSESLVNWKALVCVVAIVFALFRVLRTGSRAGLVTLAICSLIVLVAGKAKAKIIMLAGIGLCTILALSTLSSNLLLRYATLFKGTTYNAAMSEDEVSAVESTQARQMLFRESVRIMFEHPLLGVGPGIFSAALAGEQKKQGELQSWHEAHNSFSQIGSEAGIPALVFYLGVFFYCLKRTASMYRRAGRDPRMIAVRRLAACLFMSLVVFGVCAAFGNYSYSFHFPVVAGLVQALDVAVRKEGMAKLATAPIVKPAASLAASSRQVPDVAAAVLAPRRTIAPAVNPRIPSYVRNRGLPNSRA